MIIIQLIQRINDKVDEISTCHYDEDSTCNHTNITFVQVRQLAKEINQQMQNAALDGVATLQPANANFDTLLNLEFPSNTKVNGLHLESNTTLQIEEATVNQISTTSTNISSYEITSATVGHIGIPVDFSGVTQTFQLANKLKLNNESLTVTAPEMNVMKDVNLTLQAQELDMY